MPKLCVWLGAVVFLESKALKKKTIPEFQSNKLRITPPETTQLEPEKWSKMEDDAPLQRGDFQIPLYSKLGSKEKSFEKIQFHDFEGLGVASLACLVSEPEWW